jgi:parvulin-like peptidyl-prolyl isomerase
MRKLQFVFMILVLITVACSEQEPERIVVQHLLVSFDGKTPTANRTMAEAQTKAEKLFADIEAGADFDAMVRQHTDDRYPGKYGLTNTGIAAAGPEKNEYQRGDMVPAFGDIGFSLDVGEVGMAAYDAKQSPYGWHIIKRVK